MTKIIDGPWETKWDSISVSFLFLKVNIIPWRPSSVTYPLCYCKGVGWCHETVQNNSHYWLKKWQRSSTGRRKTKWGSIGVSLVFLKVNIILWRAGSVTYPLCCCEAVGWCNDWCHKTAQRPFVDGSEVWHFFLIVALKVLDDVRTDVMKRYKDLLLMGPKCDSSS